SKSSGKSLGSARGSLAGSSCSTPVPCVSKRSNTGGIHRTLSRASIPQSRICRCTPERTDLANGAGVVPHACFLARSLGPGRDHGGSFHHRPLIVAGRKDAIAIGLGPFPGTAEAFLRKLPSAFALRTPRTDRLAAHLAVGAEYHLVFDVWCRGGERLTGKEGRLDFIRRKCSGKSRCGYGGDCHGGHEGGAHRRSSLRSCLHHGTANRGVAQ